MIDFSGLNLRPAVHEDLGEVQRLISEQNLGDYGEVGLSKEAQTGPGHGFASAQLRQVLPQRSVSSET